ncbi:hypothetical protein TUN199_06806 [Pyrenophora tritici-repentis]|uniref:Uncharacterized protein n=2 Tax=Pyrenophora tritici-repentis TaxID=45151 RepID=B2WHT1_PYRTR|nr:uncharacterized protein PTRG_09540 [Pyrenophora tritici-repentis Pt-1C-BFP]KAI0572162.1 hypothetical protein Alg215_09950 [Pyrenophora tritici-repentis]EDU42591.1 predicted protein [Pyrenophora tritici-repentis Pt-1C-BFP]KAI0621192.1 hypothetical protein TUN199_06806 [Pyrenophora tritici-repentis]PZC96515.1 hypothetical protein A1F95_05299 [Pyrenophora tritici-repentis]PZD27222.1 hypothetical protein A1F96_06918 [Pyrenophora tritici-repentis]
MEPTSKRLLREEDEIEKLDHKAHLRKTHHPFLAHRQTDPSPSPVLSYLPIYSTTKMQFTTAFLAIVTLMVGSAAATDPPVTQTVYPTRGVTITETIFKTIPTPQPLPQSEW